MACRSRRGSAFGPARRGGRAGCLHVSNTAAGHVLTLPDDTGNDLFNAAWQPRRAAVRRAALRLLRQWRTAARGRSRRAAAASWSRSSLDRSHHATRIGPGSCRPSLTQHVRSYVKAAHGVAPERPTHGTCAAPKPMRDAAHRAAAPSQPAPARVAVPRRVAAAAARVRAERAGVVHDVVVDGGEQRPHLADLVVGNAEAVAVEHQQFGEPARLDRADPVFHAQEPVVLAREGAQRLAARDLLAGADLRAERTQARHRVVHVQPRVVRCQFARPPLAAPWKAPSMQMSSARRASSSKLSAWRKKAPPGSHDGAEVRAVMR